MKQKLYMLLFAAVMLLCGCTPGGIHSAQKPLCRVVDKITVHFENGSVQATRQYTDAEKMRRVLNYLRLIDPYGSPEEDPEATQGSRIRITLTHADGCQRFYEQRSDRYFSENGGSWMLINPQKAQELSIILGEMESDPAQ